MASMLLVPNVYSRGSGQKGRERETEKGAREKDTEEHTEKERKKERELFLFLPHFVQDQIYTCVLISQPAA